MNYFMTALAAIAVIGSGSLNEPASHLQIELTQPNEAAFTVINRSVIPPVDPWFHINSNGVGFVGNGTTIPFWSIESDRALSRELRAEITPDSTNPGAYANLWAKSTNHATSPMRLFVRADSDIYLQAGTSNNMTDNNSAIGLNASGGINFNSWNGAIKFGRMDASGLSMNGGTIYVEGGALKFRGSSGTVTVLAPA